MADKKDYYEVLGVEKMPMKQRSKKPIVRWQRSITPI